VFVRAVSFAVLLLTSTAEAQDSGLEDRLKAAVVSKFPTFTEWPASALEGRTTIDICVARPNRFGASLADLVAGESVEGRPLRVRELESLRTVETCHLLFIPARAELQTKELLTRTRKLPVLTVGDYPTFLDEGGMVRLRLIGGRVRFDVNIAAAQAVGLHLSSQLLRLAMNVRGER
jgi:hypothetical protein